MNVAKTAKGWRVDIPASKVGKRTRLYAPTREALKAVENAERLLFYAASRRE